MAQDATAACPCGRLSGAHPGHPSSGKVSKAVKTPLTFASCCGAYLAGTSLPPDPESLMRSRYTAFVRRDELYLRATWLAKNCPTVIHLRAETHWLGLEVKHAPPPAANRGTVHFVARCREAGKGQRIEENSLFEQVAGRWLYVGAA